MALKRLRSFKRTLMTIIDWNLIQKSQAILVYASVIELGLWYMNFKYLHHPYFNNDLLISFLWFLPALLIINVIMYFAGFTLKHKSEYHQLYAFTVVIYYACSLTFLPVIVGILNIANGVIFIGTVLISLLLFPRYIVYSALGICGGIYILSAILTVTGHINYALAFKPHVLLHPDIQNTYITSSMFYTVIYTAIAIYLYDICLQNQEHKDLLKQKMSCTDELTSLLNRRGLNEIVHLQMQQAKIMSQEFSLIIVDVDNFKGINDVYGHHQGDLVLQHVANVLRENLRISDVIGRYGGEEFVILLPFTSLESAQHVAESCRISLQNRPVKLPNESLDIYIKASFGVSSTASQIFDFDHLFDMADQALYRAKHNGKNQVCIA